MAWKRCLYNEVLPFMALVSVEFANVGVNTLFKAASLKGLSFYVFIVYSYALATLLLLPVPLFYRKSVPSLLKLPLLSRIFLLAFIGFLSQIAGNSGIEYSSPTLSSAMSNLTPAFTFILAAIFRMEKLIMRSSTTQAKIIGTIVSIAGALVVVLYKGPTILSNESPRPTVPSFHSPLFPTNSDWLIGGILLATQYILYSFWFIVQAQIMRICPKEMLVSFVYILFVTVISAPISFMAEQNLNAWRLGLDIASVAIVNSAIFGPCYNTIVHSWGLRLKGPIYVATFKPLSIAVAAIIGVIFLGDALHLGIVIGAAVISLGFYAVIWGNANEGGSNLDHPTIIGNVGQVSTEKVPFLQTSIQDV